jgi:hypothetical protein
LGIRAKTIGERLLDSVIEAVFDGDRGGFKAGPPTGFIPGRWHLIEGAVIYKDGLVPWDTNP